MACSSLHKAKVLDLCHATVDALEQLGSQGSGLADVLVLPSLPANDPATTKAMNRAELHCAVLMFCESLIKAMASTAPSLLTHGFANDFFNTEAATDVTDMDVDGKERKEPQSTAASMDVDGEAVQDSKGVDWSKQFSGLPGCRFHGSHGDAAALKRLKQCILRGLHEAAQTKLPPRVIRGALLTDAWCNVLRTCCECRAT